MKIRTSRDIYTLKFTAPSFTITNTWKQLTSLSVDKLTDWFVEVYASTSLCSLVCQLMMSYKEPYQDFC